MFTLPRIWKRIAEFFSLLGLTMFLGATLTMPSQVNAQTGPDLGTAASFSILAGSTVTNTGPSVVNGDIGVSPGTAIAGFPPGIVNGTIHAADAIAVQAQADAANAFNSLAGQTPCSDLTGQDLGGLILTEGVYCFSSAAQLTGTLTLNAQGNTAAVFIFQIGSTLTTASNSSIQVINGGVGCNVWWKVGSSATLGTTTSFAGNILALASITLTTGSNVCRAFALTAAVTLDSNTASMMLTATPTPTPTLTATPTLTPTLTATPASSTPTTIPPVSGCYVEVSAASINEGITFTATVKCNNFVNVYGVQFGVILAGDAATTATSYTAGTFQTAATNPLVGVNTLSLYAVSRSGEDTATGAFTLGSFLLTANKGLTNNGSYTIEIPAAGFMVSDILGGPITGLLQANPKVVVTITDIPLAQLSGMIRIKSDGNVSSLTGIDFNLGDGVTHYTAQTATGNYKDFSESALEYTAASDEALKAHVSLDMFSHLACSSDYSLIDGVNAATSQIGMLGVITLKAGDVVSVSDSAINIQDTTAIGAQFGSSTPIGEVDVNQDGKVDIFDLVHMGRNYGAIQGACG